MRRPKTNRPAAIPLAGIGCALLRLIVPAPVAAQTLGADRPQIQGPLTLAQAIRVGLSSNLMVAAAHADIRAAEAEKSAAISQTRPQVSANTYVSQGNTGNILATVGNVMPPNTLNVPQKGFADQNLTLMVPLFTGGRLQALVRAAAARERAVVADLDGVRAETSLQIKEAYYHTLLAVERVKAAKARVDATTEMVRTTQAQYAAGKGLEAAVRRVEAERAAAQRDLTFASTAQTKALLDLKMAMGVRLDSDITLTDPLVFAPPSGDLNSQLAAAVQTRPALLASRARLAALRQQTGAARAAQGPQVYGMAMADGFTSQPTGTRSGYTLGAVLSLPLLDGGQRRAETAQVQAQQERAEAELRDLELRVANEVQQAWLDLAAAAENYRTALSGLQAAQAAYNVTALRVQNQKGLLVEQLDALAALTLARGNVAEALFDHMLAAARLQRAIRRP
jgi:outer membrane protein TolC